jgi:ADP-heptose:LPS heptosyltransferase
MKRRAPRRPPEFVVPLPACNVPPDRCAVARGHASRRVLIMRTGSHGDVLMATPLLAALRRAEPNIHLTWIVERSEQQAIDANPHVDEILLWDSAWFRSLKKPLRRPFWALRTWAFRRLLRQHHYDAFVSFQPEEWPFLLKAAAAPLTVGVFDTFRQFQQQTQTSPLARLYTHPFTFEALPEHRTDQYLLPLRALHIPVPEDRRMWMGFTAEDQAAVQRFLTENGLAEYGHDGQDPLVVIAPMTTWESRCWDGARYARLADALMERGCRVVMIGSPRDKERAQVEQIVSQMHRPPMTALGCLSFRQMAALIARAACVVSGDTGPMHVAAAVGTPFVSLFGPTPVAGRAPLQGRGITLMHPVPCGPCDQEHCRNVGADALLCLRLITVEEVLEATLAFTPVLLSQ